MEKTLKWLMPSEQITAPAVIVYRNSFTIKVRTLFRLRWTADEHADLFLNGRFIAEGPARGTAKRWFMESLELELEPGDYVLTARVLMFGLQITAHSQCSKAFGFYAESEQITAPWEWQKLEKVNWLAPVIDWGVYPRAEVAEDANFDVLNGAGGEWKTAVLRADTRNITDRTLPKMEYRAEKNFRIVEPEKGKKLFIFDTYVCAWCDYRFSGKGSVTIRWAESFYEPNTFEWRDLTGKKGDRRVYENKVWEGNGNTINLPGGTVRWRDFWWKAGRYMLMEFTGDAKLESAEFYSTNYPLKKEWSLKSSCAELNTALDMAWHTLKMCSHTTFMDCPFFEQLQYVSDSRLEALCTMAATRDNRLILNCLRAFADSQTEGGLIASRTPSKYQQYIPSFALIYILYMQDVAQWRSPSLIQEFIPCARKILSFFAGQRKNGLIQLPGWIYIDTPNWKEGDPAWNFIDWVDGWLDGVPPGYCSLNIFYLLALEAMEKMDSEYSAEYAKCADELAALIRKTYEVEGKGFAEDEAQRIFSEHAQCLAILSERLPDYSPDIPGAAETSFSFSFYYLEAVRKINRPDLFAAKLKKWYNLDKEGLMTLPENFAATRSDCHTWSSHILYHYVASMIGLRPVDAESGIWELKPFIADLTELECKVPLGEGFLQVKIENGNLSCKIPDGIQILADSGKL